MPLTQIIFLNSTTTSATVSVQIFDDELVENFEFFELVLAVFPEGLQPVDVMVILDPQRVLVEISDNDFLQEFQGRHDNNRVNTKLVDTHNYTNTHLHLMYVLNIYNVRTNNTQIHTTVNYTLYTHTCTYTNAHTCTYIHVRTCTCIYVHTYMYIISTCIYMYYTDTHSNEHAHFKVLHVQDT